MARPQRARTQCTETGLCPWSSALALSPTFQLGDTQYTAEGDHGDMPSLEAAVELDLSVLDPRVDIKPGGGGVVFQYVDGRRLLLAAAGRTFELILQGRHCSVCAWIVIVSALASRS